MKPWRGLNGATYGGVYMLFPNTIITPNPWSISISTLEPVSAQKTILRARSWSPGGGRFSDGRLSQIPGYDKASKTVKSSHWKKHPLETYDFQTEDVWVCEKMQRALRSPAYSVGALAHGAGAEASLAFFQQSILNHLDAAAR